MNSPGYMRHSYAYDTESMHEAARQRKKAACIYSPCSAQSRHNYPNLLMALYSGLLDTLSFQLQPHTESSNASIMLELHTTLSTPDLGTHVCLHVNCIKSILPRSGRKTYCSLFLFAFFNWGWQNLSLLKPEQPGSEQIMQLSSIWIEKPTQHIYMTSHMATTMFEVICLATGDTKNTCPAYSGCIQFKSLCPQVLCTLGCCGFKPNRFLEPCRCDMTIT